MLFTRVRPPREFADNLALTVYDEEAAYGRLELWLAENRCEHVICMTTLQSTLGSRVMVVMTEKRLSFLDVKNVVTPVVLFEVELLQVFDLVSATEHSLHRNGPSPVSDVGEADLGDSLHTPPLREPDNVTELPHLVGKGSHGVHHCCSVLCLIGRL